MIWKRLASLAAVLYLVLGSWKGYVALFEKGKEEPRQVFPYLVSTLPPEEQAAIEQGLPIRNQRDLEQVLEDYLS